MTHEIPVFETEAEAWEVVRDKADCPFEDNHRLGYHDDAESMAEYERRANEGCCGFIDFECVIGDRMATIGCNYGH